MCEFLPHKCGGNHIAAKPPCHRLPLVLASGRGARRRLTGPITAAEADGRQ